MIEQPLFFFFFPNRKAAKSHKKMAGSKLKDSSSVVPVKNESHNKNVIPPDSSSEQGRKCRVVRYIFLPLLLHAENQLAFPRKNTIFYINCLEHW